jgi:tetratricopeptide (TPR) repeat protein
MPDQIPRPFTLPDSTQTAASATPACNRSGGVWLILAGIALVLAIAGARGHASPRPQAKAGDELNQGIALYRKSDFPGAINMLQKATADDPKLVRGWLFLGLAYTQEYVPGVDSAENKQLGMHAIESFEEAVKIDPGNKLALAGIGSTYYSLRELEKAKEWERKRQAVEPANPEPFYWVGVIDWYACYRNTRHVRENLGGTSDPPGSPS